MAGPQIGRVSTAGYPAEHGLTLPASGARALSAQGALLVSASFLLPAVAHLAGLPVRQILPMHWPVILAGLIYGWRSGLVTGLAAPGLSYLISGMPLPAVLPAMTVELATYGFVAGLLRERFGLNAFLATGVSVIGGRAVFLLIAFATGVTGTSATDYIAEALSPGLFAALAQVILLPFVAHWWVERSRRHG